jgi:hypothetical protein
MLERNKERVRRFLQKYLDTLIDIGTFDMLDRLKKYFDCVLIDTEICSNIRTANSFYKTSLKKMCIEESGDGYKLDSNMSAEYMNTFDSRINNLNNAKNDLKKLIDSMLTPSQVNAANNAFNLAANIFPGGASWDDIKNGNFWKKNKCYQYFKMKRREFIEAFRGKEGNEEFEAVSTDKILGGMTINDEKGTIELSLPSSNGIKTMVFEADPSMGIELVEIPGGEDYNVKVTDDKYKSNAALYDEKTDRIISSLRGAIEIAVEGNEDLRAQVTRIGGMRGYTSETELMTGM